MHEYCMTVKDYFNPTNLGMKKTLRGDGEDETTRICRSHDWSSTLTWHTDTGRVSQRAQEEGEKVA